MRSPLRAPQLTGLGAGSLFALPLGEVAFRGAADVQPFDLAARDWVGTHLAASGAVEYADPLGRALSELAPAALALSIVACAAWALVEPAGKRRAAALRTSGVLLGVHSAVLIPLVEWVVKPAVQRLRPEQYMHAGFYPHHHSYSFPSGHTSSAAFMSGALLLVLIPRLLDAVAQKTSKRPLSIPQPALVATWVVWSSLTGLGRVLTDAHWLTDTIAGGLLGASLLSVAVALNAQLDAQLDAKGKDHDD